MSDPQVWSWGSPMGLGVFLAGLGVFLWSIRDGTRRDRGNREK